MSKISKYIYKRTRMIYLPATPEQYITNVKIDLVFASKNPDFCSQFLNFFYSFSQIPTPLYNTAKQLNSILSQYLPNTYLLKSTNDFVDLIQTTSNNGIIASLDVESLFTNVPIDDTIEIILKHAYHHSSLPAPKIPKTILKELLELCTKESPFYSPEGKLYVQRDGVAMGSALGPLFSNFYMGHLEQEVINKKIIKPHIYSRYVDDIFLQINNKQEIIDLKHVFEQNSVLRFTYEMNVNKILPFLDVSVDASADRFKTAIYRKPTDIGSCLNSNSQCTDQYKRSVINNYLGRAYKVSQTWQQFHIEVNQIKQILINNNYSNQTVDKHIDQFIYNKIEPTNNLPQNSIPLYYKNQIHSNYKLDERILKSIVKNYTSCNQNNTKLNVIIYYRNIKTCNLVMKNSCLPPIPDSEKSRVCYKFKCPVQDCKPDEYIGYTELTLKNRLINHSYKGSIKQHFITEHNSLPSRQLLIENTKIIAQADTKYKLLIKEALLIQKHNPSINKQFDSFPNILKLHLHKTPSSGQSTTTPSLNTPTYRHGNHSNESQTQSNLNNITINSVSPNISQRINTLIESSQNNNDIHQFSPMVLRSQRNATLHTHTHT